MNGLSRWSRIVVIGLLASMAVMGQPAHPAAASTATLTCPDFAALTGAISSASSGDTIAITCSTTDTISFSGTIFTNKNFTLDASSSPAAITFDGGSAHQLIYVNAGNTIGLSGLTLANAKYGGSGGAVYNLGTLNVTGCTFTGNVGANGGAIANFNGASLTVSTSSFSNNSAGSSGGAISNDRNSSIPALPTATVSTSTFSGNSSFQGAAISNTGTMTLTGDTFSSNSASNRGGALQNFSDFGLPPSLTVSSSTFTNNFSSAGQATGGAAYFLNGTATFTDSTFSGNSASSGGALFLDNAGSNAPSVTVNTSTFSGNSAITAGQNIYGGGAALVWGGASLTITQSTLFGISSCW
jgi:hypothetical protein